MAALLSNTRETPPKDGTSERVPVTNKTPDPVDTVLNIMDTASDAANWVHDNWELSEQELNLHCEARAEEAGNLTEKAFLIAQPDSEGHADVLKDTEGHMARDVTAPKTYEQALKGRSAHLSRGHISDLMTKPITRPVLEYPRPRPRDLWPHEEPQSQESDQPIARSGASS